MAATIVDNVMSFLNPQVVGPLASRFGVSADTIQRGLQSSSAAILSGLTARVSDPGYLGQVFGLITNPANTASSLSNLASSVGTGISATASPIGDLGSRFLSSIFGTRLSSVTDLIGESSGLGSSKASTLMSMAGPLVLGALGQQVRENHLTANELGEELKSESSMWQRFLPAGFGSVLSGISSFAAATKAKAAGTVNRWLWPVVLLAGLLLLSVWFFNRTRPAVTAPPQTAAPTVPSMPALGNFFQARLPNGVELNIPENGIENKLIMFLNDPSKTVDQTTWFNFDRLLFNTGEATLQPSSQEQLGNIAAILKAYPTVHAKIGGYTDNVGDAAANMKLSQERANNVMNALVNQGVDQSRLTAEGYGDQHPVAPNTTEEGRAKNRRIALHVTQK